MTEINTEYQIGYNHGLFDGKVAILRDLTLLEQKVRATPNDSKGAIPQIAAEISAIVNKYATTDATD